MGEDTGMTSNKKFIASVVLAFAALAGSAATAQAAPPCGSGPHPVYCGSANLPHSPSQAELNASKERATQVGERVRKSFQDDVNQIKKSLGLGN